MFDFIGKAHAQIANFNPIQPIPAGTPFMTMLLRLVNWVLILAGAIAVIYLIYGGILYITAGGDAEKATKGRTAVINAVIGIVIILLAVIIVTWVNNLIRTGTA